MRDLQAKIAAIVKYRTPKGYRVIEHRDPHGGGKAQDEPKTIYCPPLRDRYALGVFLHEVGHVLLGHFKTDIPTWREEYEAEQWAIKAMQADGVRVPDEIRGAARHNVRCHCEKALAKDPDAEIDLEVLKFAFPDSWREAF